MIPQSEWTWHGQAGHLIVSNSCRFHLCTIVGNRYISTVGAYFPGKRGEMETVGSGEEDFYETMVFVREGDGVCECGCGAPAPDKWDERDGFRYATGPEAEAGHLAYCMRYAENQDASLDDGWEPNVTASRQTGRNDAEADQPSDAPGSP